MTTRQSAIAMRISPTTEHAQPQKGNVLIEFAIILPVFMLLLFGMITFSVALYNKTVLTMATRVGARSGSVYTINSDDNTRISNATTAALQACNNLITFGSAMTPTVNSAIAGDIITVTATGNYTGLYIFSGMFISAQSSMRIE